MQWPSSSCSRARSAKPVPEPAKENLHKLSQVSTGEIVHSAESDPYENNRAKPVSPRSAGPVDSIGTRSATSGRPIADYQSNSRFAGKHYRIGAQQPGLFGAKRRGSSDLYCKRRRRFHRLHLRVLIEFTPAALTPLAGVADEDAGTKGNDGLG